MLSHSCAVFLIDLSTGKTLFFIYYVQYTQIMLIGIILLVRKDLIAIIKYSKIVLILILVLKFCYNGNINIFLSYPKIKSYNFVSHKYNFHL